MGDTFVLDVKIRGDAGSLISEIGKSGAAAKTLNSQLKNVGTGIGAGKTAAALGGMRGAMVSTGAVALAMAEQHGAAMSRVGTAALGAGAALTATAGLAVKAANDWQSAWAGVTKTVDGADLGGVLEGQLRGLAQELPASHQEIAAVAEAAGQLGVKRQDVASFTKTMIDLGESTNMPADVAATQIARFNNIMGIANSQAKHLGSSIVALGNSNATTESEIMDMSMRIAAAGRQVKMTAPEILAMSASLTSVGVGAEAGGTSLSKFFVQMDKAASNGGKDLEVMAKTAGMTTEQFKKLYESKGGAARAFTEFEKGLGRMIKSGKGANEVMEELGINEVRLTTALKSMAPGAEMLEKNIELARKAFEANDKNNALIIEASKRYETAESRMAMAKNRINDALIDMGQAIAPMVADALEVLSKLVSGFNSLPAPVKQAVGVFSLFGGGALLAVGAAAKLLPMLIELKTAMTELGLASAFSGMGGKLKGALSGVGSSLAGTAIGSKVAAGASTAGGALAGFGAAAKGAAVAAAPVAGVAAAVGAAMLAVGWGTEKAAAGLQNVYSGAKPVAGELDNIGEAFAKVQAGGDATAVFFGDISSRMYTSTQQMRYAVDNLGNTSPLKFLEMPSQDNINATERLRSVLTAVANTDVSQTAASMKQLVSAGSGTDLENFSGMLGKVPELRSHYEELAKSMHLATDTATLMKIATGEIVPVFDSAGNAVAKTAMEAEQMRTVFGDLPPTSKESAEALQKTWEAAEQAASGFINIGENADKGLNAWHDAMMKQGEAVREWGANMLQAQSLVDTGQLSADALAGLEQMGPAGAAILKEALDQMAAGSMEGIQKLNEGFGAMGAGAAGSFADAFSSAGETDLTTTIMQQQGSAAATAFGQALSSGVVRTREDMQALASGFGIKIPVGAKTETMHNDLEQMKVTIDQTTGAVKIRGLDDEARATLEELGIAIDGKTGAVNINGLPKEAYSVLSALGVDIDQTNGTVKINGDTGIAKKALSDLVNQKYTAKVDAKANPASLNIVRENIMSRLAGITVPITGVLAGAVSKMNAAMPRRATGGYITGPGTGTSDSIPAWLSNGEYVMRAAAVRKYGLGFMHRVNQNRFAKGGVVGSAKFATDPREWWDEFGKAATNTFEQFAVPSVSTVQASKDVRPELSDKTMNVLYSIEEILQTISGNTAELPDLGSGSRSESYSVSSSKTFSDYDKPGKDNSRDSEKDRQRAEAEALKRFETLQGATVSYTDKIAKAFEALQAISKLLEPVVPEASKKGEVTDAARQSAAEKQQSNYENAVEKLISLQSTMGDVLTGFAKSWQVKGHERSLLDENGKPTVWDTGGKIDKTSSREQVMGLINFLQTGFKGLFDELGQVKGTMGQKAAPLEIVKQLGWDILGNIQAGKDQKYPELVNAVAQAVNQAPAGTASQKLVQPVGEIAEALKTVANPGIVTQAGGDGNLVTTSQLVSNVVKPETPAATSTAPDFGVLAKGIQDLQQKATDTFNMLMTSRITVTPEVQIVNIDDIQAHVRVIVKTKLDYADLQTQVNDAVNSIHPPAIMVPIQAGASTL